MNKQYSFLSGLPRTGSTLLCSILSQNPNLHTEGLSHVCNLMWNTYMSSANEEGNNWNKDILVAERQESIAKIMSSLIDLYYFDVNKPFILDKCRTWTLPGNVMVIKKYITDTPKILVLLRPIEEIMSSFVQIRKKNQWIESSLYDDLLSDTDPMMPAINGLLSAKESNHGEFLFVHYDDIVFDTKKTISIIYDFCGWPKYEHDLTNITRSFIQNDELYGLIGLHDVRKTVEKQKYNIELPKNILKKCYYYNSLIFED
jgi:sulfotransferase